MSKGQGGRQRELVTVPGSRGAATDHCSDLHHRSWIVADHWNARPPVPLLTCPFFKILHHLLTS